VILQSKDDFDQLAEFDPGSNTYRFLSRKQYPESATTSTSGGYSIIDGTMVCLYRMGGVLYFGVADRLFKLTDEVTSTLTREDNKVAFRLFRDGNLLFIFEYRPPVCEVPLSTDPTPFIEEEDFDFLLFVHKVLTETGRRHRVYSQ
jgi:hypothetical protein